MDYGQKKVAELKIELKNRGAKVTGTKEKLIERLNDYDRNNNFKPNKNNHSKLSSQILNMIEWPEEKLYKSVDSKTVLPNFDIVNINTYFLELYKEGIGMSDYSAVHRRGYNMLQNNYLLALVTANTSTHIFFKGQVHSENTKSLTYFASIAICNESGCIIQSVCECVAGKGPKAICKHVSVLCYAILKFREQNVWLIKHTPTQKKQVWHEPKKNPRTRDWFVNDPVFVVLLSIVYFKFIKQWGPAFMEKRQPYNLKTILIWYNLVQVLTSIYVSYNVFKIYATGYYNLLCESVPTVETPEEKDVLLVIWIYTIMKHVDLLDTIFFVLRKNYRQITFLHIYHHIGMLFLVMAGNKYAAGGHGIMVAGVNSFVHAFMYFYYLLSVVNKEYNKSIWWKKHITQLQIAQFFLMFIHFGHVLFRPDCGYPKWISMCLMPNNLMILYLFSKFYYNTYIKKKTKSE